MSLLLHEPERKTLLDHHQPQHTAVAAMVCTNWVILCWVHSVDAGMNRGTLLHRMLLDLMLTIGNGGVQMKVAMGTFR